MFRFPKKALFAIEAVLDIAYHAGLQPVQSREITRRQDIPKRYLEQALQSLVRHGILVGVRGPRGGYRLARERRRISLGQIIRAVGKADEPGDFLNDDGGRALNRSVLRPLWLELHNDFVARLDTITLDELCERANRAGLTSEGRDQLDFSI
jgi:Rrf2 family protein